MAESPFSTTDAVRNYLRILLEFHARTNLSASVLGGQMGLPIPYAHEYCFLQFRRICELIALGCLMLHGDLPHASTVNARREWNADKIMRLLRKLHADFFPQPATLQKTAEGRHHLEANAVVGALTRAELHTLYHECGEVLHRGSISSFELEKPFTQDHITRAQDWHNKLVKLMNTHIVARASGDSMYVFHVLGASGGPECIVMNFDRSGAPAVHLETFRITLTDPTQDV